MEAGARIFLSTLRDEGSFVEIFDLIPDMYFYIKDRNSQWILCNQASLRLFHIRGNKDVFGSTERDYFPPTIAGAIYADDQKVINNGERIINRVELIVGENGYLTWVSTHKIPLYDKQDTIVGLVGTSSILKQSDVLPEGYQRFRKVIDYIQENLANRIDVSILAEMSCLSNSQFRKVFRQQFRHAPREFILRTRLQAASKLLLQTNKPIIQVALDCGFTDQSYFTRQFSKFFEQTPLKYRSEGSSS